MSKHLFPYQWYLKDGYPAKNIFNHGLKVFGTFICGGGSSMGYKLAGYNHLGGVEIDPKVAAVYNANHKPKYLYIEDIRKFNQRKDLPEELYDLDIFDGSPPCSSFSTVGKREKDWGKEKKFKEGQALQVLDDLVFEYCDAIIKLNPKVAILENVKGIIQGNAKQYTLKIFNKLKSAGFEVQLFLLNSATMGVPQKRERVFFIIRRTNLNLPDLKLEFNEEVVPFYDVSDNLDLFNNLTALEEIYWEKALPGKAVGKFKTNQKYKLEEPANTIVSGSSFYHPEIKRQINSKEYSLIGSYPLDYDFGNIKPRYLIGMSVPPVMTAQIANQIYLQWLSKI